MKLGSLFDGSGGFPLAATLAGIEPVWASEIEPFPIAVTRKHFPRMTHVGEISKLDGAKLPPVDIITFGSPCTDLSVAGRREGIKAQRSGLFFQAVRVIKEMRKATDGEYPRYAIWENVPGAFSSNQGNDFATVLTAIIHITYPQASKVPTPSMWAGADLIVGPGFSIAWRTLDAQYWGVPQRRKRIFLIADFASERAHEILFDSPSSEGNPRAGGKERPDSTGKITQSSGVSSESVIFENHGTDSRYTPAPVSPTLSCRMGTGGGNVPLVLDDQGGTVIRVSDTVPTLRAESHGHQPIVLDTVAMRMRSGCEGGGKGPLLQVEKSNTLATDNDQTIFQPSYNLHFHMDRNTGGSADCVSNIARCLDTGISPNRNQGGTVILAPPQYLARQLTPAECARLQGFPDWWCANLGIENPTNKEIAFWTHVWDTWQSLRGKKPRSEKQIRKWLTNPHTDSAEYKMWGNGIALPCVQHIMEKIKL